MSERQYGRRIPVNRRARRSQQPSPSPPSPSPLRPRRRTPVPRRPSRPLKSLVLKRCNSEPALWRSEDDQRTTKTRLPLPDEEVLFRPQTCTDLFSSPDYSLSLSPHKCLKGFNKDTKVVVSVTVEGSPGPIRTMVKLGSNVEEAIRHFVRKYNEEARTPQIDKDAAAMFELHHSYFSLQSLSNTDVIGDMGNRSFYLRKSSSSSGKPELEISSLETHPVTPVSSVSSPPLVILPGFVSGNFKKIVIRRTRKLCKILGCLQCCV